jgi:acetylornithine deacetylase/succinyl-diaminopimelate desuccinylase-like protein
MSAVESALAWFDRNRDQFLLDLFTLLRFESISTQPEKKEQMTRCADWLRKQLVDTGFEAQVMPTDGHPVVFADSGPVNGEDTPTLLFYGHYDVQPIGNVKLWTAPPFEPTIRNGAIYARGAADDKGQLMTHLAAIQSWRNGVGSLPVRIKFLLEGEEEIGSPNTPAFVRQNRDLLACDYVVISDSAKHDAETPAIPYATRGLLYKQITVSGPARDLHSGHYGGAVANPANVLAKLLASLHDKHNRVTVPGFYDDVHELTEREKQEMARIATGDSELLSATGSPAPFGEEGYTSDERRTARPTLDINGLLSGFTGEGAATIVPAQAAAKVSMRLVPDQDPDKISRRFDQFLQEQCPDAVSLNIEIHSACKAYMAPTDSPGLRAAAEALRESYGRDPVLCREGGTLPILPVFKETLGADSLLIGFALPECNLHSPDEFFMQSDFETGTRCILRFLNHCADLHTNT